MLAIIEMYIFGIEDSSGSAFMSVQCLLASLYVSSMYMYEQVNIFVLGLLSFPALLGWRSERISDIISAHT